MTVSPAAAFTPADEVQDPDRFAGRVGELRLLSDALHSLGAHIVLYGKRGIGKSSLARQLELLASGDPRVHARMGPVSNPPTEFFTVFFRCDDSVTSIPRLLLRLLSDETALAPWVPFAVVERRTLAEVDGRLSIKVISVGGKGSTGITEAAPELETDVVSVFNNALHSLAKARVAKSGILIIIDEFDRIPDKRGLASLLKTLGPLGVKIALIGVATNVQDLILDHESVARQLSDGSVHVPPMTDLEMNEIFDRAEAVLETRYQFSPDARDWIIGVAKGHPFYVHLIGKHALLRTIANGESVVSVSAAQAALQEIALKGSAPIQESAYKTAIGHSYIREYLLKEFSAVDTEEIHTTELYAKVSGVLRIDPGAVSVYVGQLASDKYGGVLERTRDRYYRFRDSLFKAYAAARPRLLHPGDQEEA